MKSIYKMSQKEMRQRLMLYHEFMSENGLGLMTFEAWFKKRERSSSTGRRK